jgi:N-acetylglutamate synthase-like GNAT family acetyltransferase|tara:strand:+ start:666 stop:1136 length:471 start_codon:yes stop_codon:yes gene_type:complete
MKIDTLSTHRNFIPILSQWHHEQWSYLNPSRSVEDRIEEFQQETARKEIPTTFVAMSGNVLLGSASIVAHDMDTRMHLTPWLASVYVTPRHREQGIGSELVKRTVEEAKELGVKTLYLYTPDRERFYKRLGWSVLELEKYHGENVVIMTLHLTHDQ